MSTAQKQPLGRRPSLSEDERKRLRRIVEELIEKHGSQAELHRLSGIKQQNFSKIMNDQLVGEAFAEELGNFLGLDWRAMIGRRDVVEVRRPTWGALPGWAEAEALARARHPRIPDEAWVNAREFSGASAPDPVTPEFVYAAARMWLDYLAT